MSKFLDDRPEMRRRSRSSMGIGSVIAVLLFVWLIIGAVAAGQRDYFDSAPTNCASTGTIAVTIIAGPLNYLGVNPKIADCGGDLPQPSP